HFLITNIIHGMHFHFLFVHAYRHEFGKFVWLFLLRLSATLLNFVGITAFGVTISFNMEKKKMKTFAYGMIALVMMEASTIYGLITVFRQGNWMTR
ncbi:MAG: hypothetical protein ACP5UV_00830, partial [Thermoplasmata archaeon]